MSLPPDTIFTVCDSRLSLWLPKSEQDTESTRPLQPLCWDLESQIIGALFLSEMCTKKNYYANCTVVGSLHKSLPCSLSPLNQTGIARKPEGEKHFLLIQQSCLQGLCVTLSFINPSSAHYLSIIVVLEEETGAPRSWLTSGKQRNDQYTVPLCHF